jgi:hypothetical protein
VERLEENLNPNNNTNKITIISSQVIRKIKVNYCKLAAYSKLMGHAGPVHGKPSLDLSSRFGPSLAWTIVLLSSQTNQALT